MYSPAATAIPMMCPSLRAQPGPSVLILGSYVSRSTATSLYPVRSGNPDGPNEKTFSNIGLSYKVGNGGLINDEDYFISLLSYAGTGDLHFTYVQGVPSTSWNIQHNLGKFPSITVIDSAGTVVTGQYTYNDINNVTLTFSAPFAGTAYLN